MIKGKEKVTSISDVKLMSEIKKLEDKRDEYNSGSAEWVELDDQIEIILKVIRICTVR